MVVAGPTASGKTPLSLAMAERFDGEIVNCDSVAMYREFEVGTAKPAAAERLRAPHHLLDFVAPTEYITAGQYARQARPVIKEIDSRGHLPIVVGGTGLYLRALLEGLFPGPQRSEKLRQRLRERHASRGSNYSRRKMTELWQQQGRDPLLGFRILRIGLDPDRNALYERINQRAQNMFEHGLIQESETLLQKYGDAARPLTSLGYRQAVEFLHGDLSREQALEAAQQAHRNYAKRQMTWFRREPEVTWLNGFGSDPQIQRVATDLVKASLRPDQP